MNCVFVCFCHRLFYIKFPVNDILGFCFYQYRLNSANIPSIPGRFGGYRDKDGSSVGSSFLPAAG